ncbi:MAG: bifunctional diaminohydroxyphosphoribosylaminopyrimidine deaminase/5-amino-6-(5-phosphoribosylamino)uracil reductase RibD [Ferruginibacter sp.]
MHRCLQLASLGAGRVAPNPMVGAVLVHKNRIIGEGYHQQFGKPHAEVNCIHSVKETDRDLISTSTLYVSLEPCAHFGKTPPCADLIIKNKIPNVVIGCRDSFTAVNGKGIERLGAAGIEVTVGILEPDCLAMNRRFFTFHAKQRPFVILKWAQTSDGFMAQQNAGRLLISNEYTNRLVHKWRTEEASILVGTNTALMDDPLLTARLWPGNNPVRLVIDKELKLPAHLKLFDGSAKTVIFNRLKQAVSANISYQQLNREEPVPDQVLTALHAMSIQSVMVEGGSKLLQSFIAAGLWDEARVIVNEQLTMGEGLKAPELKNKILISRQKDKTDLITFYKRDEAVKANDQ